MRRQLKDDERRRNRTDETELAFCDEQVKTKAEGVNEQLRRSGDLLLYYTKRTLKHPQWLSAYCMFRTIAARGDPCYKGARLKTRRWKVPRA